MIEEAVYLQPRQHLAYRDWCYFHFLRDYEQAAADWTPVVTQAQGQPRYNKEGATTYALCWLCAGGC